VRRRQYSFSSRELVIEPDSIAELDSVDRQAGFVPSSYRKRVSFDRAHPKSETLIEQQIADIDGGSGNDEPRARFVASDSCRGLDERPTNATSLHHGVDRQALDLELPRSMRARDLYVPDNLAFS
jgi:hypothetical protein